MMALCCFYTFRKKNAHEGDKNFKNLHVKVEHIQKSSERPSSFSVPIPFPLAGSSRCKVKIVDHVAAGDVDCERGDEYDESLSMKKEYSYCDLQALENEEERSIRVNNQVISDQCLDMNICNMSGKMYIEVEGKEMTTIGHISDPGISKTEILAFTRLKRSCSDLAISSMSKELTRQRPHSDEEELILDRDKGCAKSPVSVATHHSADKVILKKHSSSQILPSANRRLWWKLFLWSHRNLHRAQTVKQQANSDKINQQGGYCSDTAEESGQANNIDQFYTYGSCGTWPQNQWVAFPAESSSPFARVDEWVKEVSAASLQPSFRAVSEDDIIFPPSPAVAIGSSHLTSRSHTVTEEASHANSVIQSLNCSSTVAHVAGIGLKVIPYMSRFSSLRSLNVSGNFIAHITPGSLPKGLHVLNLSRNKVTIIEGLRELTRLRVLDLSYNRISRIGHGLSNCTLIKELYLSGNKISSVEGLHRLLKLTVLDLSFNKITTKKALGQLVANYNSLIALNLLGNPIQGNVCDKTICSLLPKLVFLNRQPINHQRAREIGTDVIAKAAHGSSTRGKVLKRATQGHSSTHTNTTRRRQRSKTHSSAKDKTR